MALIMRKGAFEDLDPNKMLPAEWAIVLSGDPVVSDGKSAFICFAAGDVKRIATYNDMVQQFNDMLEDTIVDLTEGINVATANSLSATEYANNAGNNADAKAQAAEAAANTANGVASDLTARREAGEFTGPVGPVGPPGKDGENGVVTTMQGQFAFQVQDGHLILIYPDATTPPNFAIDDSGHLVLTL